MILAVFAIVLTLLLVVGIHEVGHAIAARLFKVKIRRIAIGFGKALFTWQDQGGREWVWALWPLGGYVHLFNSRIETIPTSDLDFCFDKKAIWQRCIILIAGALANLLTAALALTWMYSLGYQQQVPLIQQVSPGSIAAAAGLQAQERFVAIDSQETNSWQDVGMTLLMAMGKAKVAALVGDKQGSIHQVSMDLSQWSYKKDDPSLLGALGIKAVKGHSEQVRGQSLWPALLAAMSKLGFLLKFFLVMLKQLLTQRIPFAVLLGPLGLFAASVYSFLQGLAVFLYFIASLSLAVGLVNLFPIPGLDGGGLVYALLEKWRGKPVSVAFEVLLYRLTMIIFALLLIQLIMNDLRSYFSK